MLPNSAEFTADELNIIFNTKNNSKNKFQSQLLNISPASHFSGVSIDSREIAAGNIFIALSGENADGHTYLNAAKEKGASAFIINSTYKDKTLAEFADFPIIVCNNTLTALAKLATYHRNRFDYPVVLIGGSNGKTTTKEMTATLLSQKFNVLKTYRNYNNQLGLPLMLLQMNNNFNMAVLEIGTNEPGEMLILSSMANPTHGILTNIGKEHLEKLIDLDGVELEESYLFGILKKNDGFAFVNIDDERLAKYLILLDKKMTFGTTLESELRAEYVLNGKLNPMITFHYQDRVFTANMKTGGSVTALNAIAATAIAIHFNMTDEDIIKGLESYKPECGHGYGRMLLEETEKFTIINDCYNANPESMKAALKSLEDMETAGKAAILGDMRELGDASKTEHIEILKIASKVADKVFIIGEEFGKAYLNTKLKNVEFFSEKSELLTAFSEEKDNFKLVLIKGSRSMKMECFVEQLKSE